MIRYSVIVSWANRHALAIAAMKNAPAFSRPDVEIIVVNAGGSPDTLMGLHAVAGFSSMRCLDLPGATFNRSLCMNVGAFVSRGEHLFLLDCDMYMNSDFLDAAGKLLDDGGCYVTMMRILEAQPERDENDWTFLEEMVRTLEIRTKDGRCATLINRIGERIRPSHGMVILRKVDMLRAGGLNADLRGWGFEDTDFQTRLQMGYGLTCIECGELTHLTHDASARDFKQWRANKDAAYARYKQGNYTGTYERDVAEWAPRVVELTPATVG